MCIVMVYCNLNLLISAIFLYVVGLMFTKPCFAHNNLKSIRLELNIKIVGGVPVEFMATKGVVHEFMATKEVVLEFQLQMRRPPILRCHQH